MNFWHDCYFVLNGDREVVAEFQVFRSLHVSLTEFEIGPSLYLTVSIWEVVALGQEFPKTPWLRCRV